MGSSDQFPNLTEVAHCDTIDSKPIVLNRKQCHHLAQTCMSTLEKMRVASLPDRLKKELHGTILEILVYFESCTEDLWLSSLATHLDPQEAYLLHLNDFIVCMASSLALDECHHYGVPFVDCFIRALSDCENTVSSSELEEHVSADWQEMLGLLRRTVKEKHEVLEQVRLVDQVSRKCCLPLKFRRKGFNIPPPLPSPSLKNKHHLAVFLAQKFDEKVSLPPSPPKSVPKAYHIDSKEMSVLKGSLIGEEGCSKVYEQTWLDQKVAVKEFSTEDETFIKEASLLAGLSNPYVIKMIGWSRNQAKGTFSLIMERMDEGLHDYLARSMLPSLEVAVDIMLQISRGMEYLHGMKVMHRDLKPPNVLVRSCRRKVGYLRIKLSDFGVAKYQPETPFFSTERQGTWYYRAPEVLQYAESIEGEHVNVAFKKYTLKADVFSFAVVCYEILAQRAPDCFICYPKEFYNRVTNNVRPELPGSCPPLLSDCIKRCWHSEPSSRPTFAELSQVLVYIKSALMVLDSPTIAKESSILSKFVKKVHEEAVKEDDEEVV